MKKKILTIMLPFLLMGTIAGAVWWQSWQDVGAVSVTSNRPIEFEIKASFLDVDVMNGSNSTSLNISIENRKDTALTYDFSQTVTLTELEPVECPDSAGDITVENMFNDVEVLDGETVALDPGMSELNMTVYAKENSCPVDITVETALDVI